MRLDNELEPVFSAVRNVINVASCAAMTDNTRQKAGVTAVVGRTNVGKSTLLNALLGEKVSIVSDTVQTTRNVIRAILTEERGQIVFLDTPGIHKAEGDLGKNLNKMARSAIGGADSVLLVLDASAKPWQEDEGWMRRLMKDETPCVILLNKMDLGGDFAEEYKKIWKDTAEEKGATLPPVWVEGSALNGDQLPELSEALFEQIPEGPLLFPEEILTDYPRKLNISDVIREKYFDRLHDELPHCLAIWVESIEETPAKWNIQAEVYVERHSQKGIVIGEKGRLLKSVQYQAEKELQEMYGVPIKVRLWVKVEKDWRKNFWILKKLGYA
ncbi:GTPase Era [Tichowtungia aerotolerans]|uniref:GTPase Era n=1 Tax=Tichowtungia aerotolerans TaxID=2697043 RepID=A0A6P1M0H0_9BACT|nr:GTPase Era [Tichowtungia aerotolerans]QHI68289.1 GTPase Era [Tichowtungia aerotolerans]